MLDSINPAHVPHFYTYCTVQADSELNNRSGPVVQYLRFTLGFYPQLQQRQSLADVTEHVPATN